MRGHLKTSADRVAETGRLQNNPKSRINIAECLICNGQSPSIQRINRKRPLKNMCFSGVFRIENEGVFAMSDEDPMQAHDSQAKAITKAVAGLLTKFGPLGFTPEAIFEGAIRGGAVVLLAGTSATVADVADLLTEVGNDFRDLAKPNFKVVQ